MSCSVTEQWCDGEKHKRGTPRPCVKLRGTGEKPIKGEIQVLAASLMWGSQRGVPLGPSTCSPFVQISSSARAVQHQKPLLKHNGMSFERSFHKTRFDRPTTWQTKKESSQLPPRFQSRQTGLSNMALLGLVALCDTRHRALALILYEVSHEGVCLVVVTSVDSSEY